MNSDMSRNDICRVGKLAVPRRRVSADLMKAAAIAAHTGVTLAVFAATILAATFLAPAAQAQTETVLYNFLGSGGQAPNSAMVLDSQGNLFGTTQYGGTHEKGVAFELAPDGSESVLHNFNGSTSAYPSGLISDAAGNLYGVSAGLGLRGGHGYYGTVYELKNRKKDRKGLRYGFDRLYNFTNYNQVASGAVPVAGLVVDAQGDVFGTTSEGGAFNSGTIFEVTPLRTESVLYNFTGGADGFHPYGGLIRDGQGNYYGTTFQGGVAGSGCNFGCGVVFKLAPDGTETVLYDFTGGADGSGPLGGLVLDGQGNLYGTTIGGGNLTCSGTGCGVVFKIAAAGGETVLYSFLGDNDGMHPESSLILDAQDNLYGTTYEGGGSNCNGYGCGTVFKVSATGAETVLYRFTGSTDGGTPLAGLVMDSQGNLYGTTESGGFGCVSGCGVVFKITP